MKKILFLLLLSVTTYGQTYQNTTFGTVKTMTAPTVTATPHLGTVESNGVISKITPENLPVSTATTNALELETDVSSGAVSGFALTNNGNGTVNIASGIAYLKITNDPYAQVIKYPISGVANLTLTDNANNFVLVDYNSGSPTLTVTTNSSTINTQTNSLAYVIARVGNDLEYLSLVGQNVDPNAKLRIRFLNQEGIRRASGASLGFSSRNLTLTSSVLFSGLIRINAVAFNTASPDTFTLAYNNGATWTRTTGQTQVNNTQYNVSGTLTALNTNDYRTDYVYLLPNNPSKLYVIMGTTSYANLTAAKTAPRPSALPVELQVLGLEVGRLFIQKNSAAIAEVQSSFANDFVGAAVPEHNALTGLQGGTSGEYNHLTNVQISLVNGAEQIANKATDFTTVNNTLYPTVQAVKTYADGLVVGLLNDRGSYDASTNLYPSTGGSGTAGAILKGNLWAISVAGTLGGVSVGIGDWVRALVDTPAQTAANWSVVEGNFGYVPANDVNVIHKTGNEIATGVKELENIALTANPVGSTPNKFTQIMGGSDFWSIYGDASVGDNGKMVFEVGDNAESSGQTFEFRYNSSNSGIAKTPLKIDYNDITAIANITATSFVKSGGVSSQFLKADGSVDTNSYHTGTMTSGHLPKATGSSTLSNSLIYDDGTNIGIGIMSPLQSLDISSNLNLRGGQIFCGNDGGNTFFANAAQHIFRAGSGGSFAERMSIDVGGVVKINNLSGSVTRNVVADASGKLSTDSTVYAPLASPTLTGSPTAPTATAGTNTTQIATTAFVQTATGGYAKYVALISQSGTSAPTATVLENTLGGTLVWTRSGTGFYVGTLSGVFTANKTTVFNNITTTPSSVLALRNSVNEVIIDVRDSSNNPIDNGLVGTSLEIRVYP